MGNTSSSPHNLSFTLVCNKADALNLLNISEKKDFYLEECRDDTTNFKARINSSYSPNNISLRDKQYAESFLNGMASFLPGRLLSDLNNINIIQLMPSADGGMPHTRPNNIICFPDISQLFSITTLTHELWHCHQRIYNELWFKTFNKLGWTLWNGKLPEQLEKARRYNPDTLEWPFWLFNNKWVPIPIFRDITRPNVSQVDIWFYNPEKKYHITRVPPEIEEYFPNLPPSAYEHPREITAYMLSEPDKYRNSKGFTDLIESIGNISIVQKDSLISR